MCKIRHRSKIAKSIIFLVAILACVLLVRILIPLGESKNKLSEIFLAQPAFAQQIAFPSDEVGISAYVNVGQSIDLGRAKNAFRGIQAEGDNYVIGIMELPGLPEEEFPHMYISSDGWILAYYSKFAPTARIIQWYGYGGDKITTTTLQDAIAKICPTIGANFNQVRDNVAYYHFKYPQATSMVVAIDYFDEEKPRDSFNYSIPSSLTLYEASGSLWYDTRYINNSAYARIDGEDMFYLDWEGIDCGYLESRHLTVDKVHSVEIFWEPAFFGLVFVYQ